MHISDWSSAVFSSDLWLLLQLDLVDDLGNSTDRVNTRHHVCRAEHEGRMDNPPLLFLAKSRMLRGQNQILKRKKPDRLCSIAGNLSEQVLMRSEGAHPVLERSEEHASELQSLMRS